MNRQVRCALAAMFVSGVIASSAFAQVGSTAADPAPPRHRSARVETLLQGGHPLSDFSAAATVLARGHEVIVTDASGASTRGLISAVSPDGLVLYRKGGLFSASREQVFRADGIQTIRVVDSHWNGALLGLAAGIGILAVVGRTCSGECQGPIAYASLAAVLAPGLGAGIDDLRNAAVYDRRPQARAVSLAPLFARRAVGARVLVGF